MMSDWQFVIDSRGLRVWQSGRGQTRQLSWFERADPQAPAHFARWLGTRRVRCTLIADLAEERHVVEQLPRTSRADRHALIQRRLAQCYPDVPFTCARPLPRPRAAGQRDPVLLAALTRPSLLDPWLDALDEAVTKGTTTIRALTSVPFLLERWYRRQHALPAQSLLLALGGGGMRQTLFCQRRLCFTRVIAARAASLAECLPVYVAELAQTLAWIGSQRLTEGSPAIRVLAPGASLPTLGGLADGVSVDIDFVDLDAQLETSHAPDDTHDILPLVLEEARRRGDCARYACPRLRPARSIAMTRRAMLGVTTLFALSALVAGSLDFGASADLEREIARLDTARHALREELARLQTVPAEAVASAELTGWLDTVEPLSRDSGIAPVTALRAAADLLAEAPWARLEILAWRIAPSAPDTSASAPPTETAAASAADGFIELTLALDTDAPAPRQIVAVLESAWRRKHGHSALIKLDPANDKLSFSAPFAALPSTSPRSEP
jgi:hypothetical protein